MAGMGGKLPLGLGAAAARQVDASRAESVVSRPSNVGYVIALWIVRAFRVEMPEGFHHAFY